jgi:hypothetical protein
MTKITLRGLNIEKLPFFYVQMKCLLQRVRVCEAQVLDEPASGHQAISSTVFGVSGYQAIRSTVFGVRGGPVRSWC